MRKPKKFDSIEENPTPDMAWFRQKAEERNTSIAHLSKAATPGKDLLARSLKNNREFKPRELVTIAHFLDVPMGELFFRLGYPITSSHCPIIGYVNGLARLKYREPAPGGGFDLIEAPAEHGDWVAVRVETLGSRLEVFDGYTYFYQPREQVVQGGIGRLAVIKTPELNGPVIGTYTPDGSEGGTITLLGGETMSTEKPTSISPIEWTKMR